MKIRPVGAKFFRVDGRTDRHTWGSFLRKLVQKQRVVCDWKYLCIFGTSIKAAKYSMGNFDNSDT